MSARVFLLGHTYPEHENINEWLRALGTTNKYADSKGEEVKELGAESIVELAGRSCYRSFEVEMNKNLTRIRKDQKEYIGNILKQKHGSILEHVSATFGIVGCTRVFTHELVRHRVGTAFSQESGRYVRIDENMEIPESKFLMEELGLSDTQVSHIRHIWECHKDVTIGIINELEQIIGIDKLSFEKKKKATSAIRRLAPNGLATNIVFTANARALRHLISLRTDRGAEEEIRQIFSSIAFICKELWPSIFQDMYAVNVESTFSELKFKNEKI